MLEIVRVRMSELFVLSCHHLSAQVFELNILHFFGPRQFEPYIQPLHPLYYLLIALANLTLN